MTGTEFETLWKAVYSLTAIVGELIQEVKRFEAAHPQDDRGAGEVTMPPPPASNPGPELAPSVRTSPAQPGPATGQGGGTIPGSGTPRSEPPTAPRNPDFTERSSRWHQNAMRGSIAAQWSGACAICDNTIALDSPIRKTLNDAGRYVWGHYDCVQAVEEARR